jgi:hypothetical protein
MACGVRCVIAMAAACVGAPVGGRWRLPRGRRASCGGRCRCLLLAASTCVQAPAATLRLPTYHWQLLHSVASGKSADVVQQLARLATGRCARWWGAAGSPPMFVLLLPLSAAQGGCSSSGHRGRVSIGARSAVSVGCCCLGCRPLAASGSRGRTASGVAQSCMPCCVGVGWDVGWMCEV